MKTIITESQTDNLIKSILKEHGIKVSFGYKQRTYNGVGQQFDSVYVWFDYPDNLTMVERMIHFKTKGYKVIGVDSHGNFFNIIDEFNYFTQDNRYLKYLQNIFLLYRKILGTSIHA